MRFIYIDEAGIAPKEKVRVVAGVIVEADKQLRMIERAVIDLYDKSIPAKIRNNFTFHATDVYSGKYFLSNDQWPILQRIKLLEDILSIPRKFSAPICFANIFSGTMPPGWKPRGKLRLHEFEHMQAFGCCLNRADLYLKNLGGAEVGAVVAESIPHMERHLSTSMIIHKEYMKEFIFPPGRRDNTLPQGTNPKPYSLGISHIINAPLFMKKGTAPMLDIADACAFAIRRWVNGYDYAENLVRSMFGDHYAKKVLKDPVWKDGPMSISLVDHEKNAAEEQAAG